jgi:insulysin
MLSEIAFRFKEKSPPTTTAMQLSLQMSKPYPRELLLSAPWLTSSWDEDIIMAATNHLSVDECRMMVASQEPLVGKDYNMREKWYGTEYTIEPLSDRLLKASQLCP